MAIVTEMKIRFCPQMKMMYTDKSDGKVNYVLRAPNALRKGFEEPASLERRVVLGILDSSCSAGL
jgi:hypothetical protein